MRLFNSSRSKHSLFEIRLDSDFVVFRGGHSDAAPQTVKGVVVLCLSVPLKIEDVRVRLEGTLRHRWADDSMYPHLQPVRVDSRTEISRKVESIVKDTPTTLPAGNYQWPFEFQLPGSTPESVEGLSEASITWKVRATVDRGKLAHDLHAAKHLRIVRSLPPNSLALLQSSSVDFVWPGKVSYSISMPQRVVALGQRARFEVRMAPLSKGLELAEVSARLVEVREFSQEGVTAFSRRQHKIEKSIRAWGFSLTPEEYLVEPADEVAAVAAEAGVTTADEWFVSKQVRLPSSLAECAQDLDHHGIRIRHRLEVKVGIKNLDGHMSQLRAKLPCTVYISPTVPMDESGTVLDQTPGGLDAADAVAPPRYDQRHLDQLYGDIDAAGYLTPAVGSGPATPFQVLSRVPSVEKLGNVLHDRGIHPDELQAVLRGLAGPAGPTQEAAAAAAAWAVAFPSAAQTPGGGQTATAPASEGANSQRQSRSQSPERAPPRQMSASDLAALSRVPSYGTAIRTPVRPVVLDGGLPDYNTSQRLTRPSSPEDSRADEQPGESPTRTSTHSPGTAPRLARLAHRPFSSTMLNFLHRGGGEEPSRGGTGG